MLVTVRQLMKYSAAQAAASTIGIELPLPKASVAQEAVSSQGSPEPVMCFVGMVVEIRDGRAEQVLGSIARIPEASVYGVKDSSVVIVIEGSSRRSIDDAIAAITDLNGVERVHTADRPA